MKRRMKEQTALWLSMACAVAMFVIAGLMIAPALKGFRLDLTDSRENTLSAEVMALIDDIRDPVTIKIYYSKALNLSAPRYGYFFTRLENLLRQYEQYAGGRIKLEIYDPEPFSDAALQAKNYGLRGLPVDRSGAVGYFGAVMTDAFDNHVAIPRFYPESPSALNYRIAKLLMAYLSPKRPAIAILSPLQMMETVQFDLEKGRKSTIPAWPLIEELEDYYDISMLSPDNLNFPDEIDVLVVAYPMQISNLTAYAIEQYLLRGGRMILLLDPFSEVALMRRLPPYYEDSRIDGIASSLGVSLRPGAVLSDLTVAQDMVVHRDYGTVQTQNVLWMNLGRDLMNQDSPVTASLSNLVLASAGILEVAPKEGLEATPLVKSGPNAMVLDRSELADAKSYERLKSMFKPGNAQHDVAMRIRGVFASSYGDSPPPIHLDALKVLFREHHETSLKPTDVIVVSDSDFIFGNFWLRRLNASSLDSLLVPYADNANFILNALDALTDNAYLSGLRRASAITHPFTRLDNSVAAVKARYSALNAESFRIWEEAGSAINQVMRELADNPSPPFEMFQRMQTLKKSMEEAEISISANNRMMQREVSGHYGTIKLLGTFSAPLFLLLCFIVHRIFRRRHG